MGYLMFALFLAALGYAVFKIFSAAKDEDYNFYGSRDLMTGTSETGTERYWRRRRVKFIDDPLKVKRFDNSIRIGRYIGWRIQNGKFLPPDKTEPLYRTYDDGELPYDFPKYYESLEEIQKVVKCQDVKFKYEFQRRLESLAESYGLLFCELSASDWCDAFLDLKLALGEELPDEGGGILTVIPDETDENS